MHPCYDHSIVNVQLLSLIEVHYYICIMAFRCSTTGSLGFGHLLSKGLTIIYEINMYYSSENGFNSVPYYSCGYQ